LQLFLNRIALKVKNFRKFWKFWKFWKFLEIFGNFWNFGKFWKFLEIFWKNEKFGKNFQKFWNLEILAKKTLFLNFFEKTKCSKLRFFFEIFRIFSNFFVGKFRKISKRN